MERDLSPGTPAPEGPLPPSARLARRRWALLILLSTVLLALGFFSIYPRGSATGAIQSRGAPHGDFVVQPVTCFSGGHWGFTGVWVVTETLTAGHRRGFKGGLKIVKDDTGEWEAYVENPTVCEGFKCEQRQVDRRQCRVFDLRVDGMNAWLRYDGHARFECAFPAGGSLTANLTFTGCARVPSGGEDAAF